jgi:hypothetical protein
MERLLRETLRADPGETGADCLEAETVAAWFDGGLTQDEREIAQRHLADCAHCQSLLAAFVRTEPADQPSSAVARSRFVWWRVPAVRWIASLVGAAAAVAIWIALPERQERRPSAPSDGTVAVAEQSPPVQSPSLDAPRATAPAPPSDSARQDRGGSATDRGAAADSVRPTDVNRSAPAPSGATAEAANAEPRTANAPQTVTGAPPPGTSFMVPETNPPAVPSTPAPSAAADAQAAARAPEARGGAVGAIAGAGIAGGRAGIAGGGRGGGGGRGVGTGVGPGRGAFVVQTASDASVRWRINASVVEHSLDGGVSWSALPFVGDAAVLERLVAGSSPSRTVCWFVGSGGAVVIADDRGSRPLPFPEATALVQINATSAAAAAVTAADGRVFVTTDGGITWRQGRPQNF